MATQRRLALISVIEQLAEPDCCTVETYQEIIQRNPEFKQARANNLEFSKQLRNGRKKTIHDTHVKLNTHAQRRYTLPAKVTDVIVPPSVCRLSVICNVGAPYSGD